MNNSQWQPITMLPVFTGMLDGMLKSLEEQLDNIRVAADNPHVLDDVMLNRMIKLYNNQLDDQKLFEEQFVRWKQENLSQAEEKEVDRLLMQSLKLKEVNEEILAIIHSIEQATIYKIVRMDELELHDALVSDKIKPPR